MVLEKPDRFRCFFLISATLTSSWMFPSALVAAPAVAFRRFLMILFTRFIIVLLFYYLMICSIRFRNYSIYRIKSMDVECFFIQMLLFSFSNIGISSTSLRQTSFPVSVYLQTPLFPSPRINNATCRECMLLENRREFFAFDYPVPSGVF
jgi:hypothetical protein